MDKVLLRTHHAYSNVHPGVRVPSEQIVHQDVHVLLYPVYDLFCRQLHIIPRQPQAAARCRGALRPVRTEPDLPENAEDQAGCIRQAEHEKQRQFRSPGALHR